MREWLVAENKDAAWLAARLGVTARTVYGWMSGRAPRDRSHITRIAEITEGKVSANDILLRPDPRSGPGRPVRKKACCA